MPKAVVKSLLRLCSYLAALSLVGTLSLIPFSANASPSEAKFLQKVAEQYILAQFPKELPGKKVQVEAGRLDDRRDYGGKCEGYLTAELRGKEITSSSQVKITCTQPGNEYSLYIPVKVTMLSAVLVASRNLARGSMITPSDLQTSYQPENTIQASGINDPNVLIGSRLKRDVKEGEQIRANSFCVVCKNDKVSIVAKSGGLSLKTSGQALEEGAINSNIRVKNLKSNKIIYAVVRSPGEVEVVF